MGSVTASELLRIKGRDGLWLALAVFLHALIFLIPVQQPAPEHESPALSIALLRASRIAPALREPVEAPAPPQDIVLPEKGAVVTPEAALADDIPADRGEKTRVDERVKPELITTTARLIDSARQFKWTLPDQKQTLQLGIFTPRDLPANWRPNLFMEENRFDGMTLPKRTEIIDRWLGADGSHNVVVNTPTGHTFCGRAETWNPMSPLVEHVMMFRPCGGGGERSFKMPERYRSSHDRLGSNNSSVFR